MLPTPSTRTHATPQAIHDSLIRSNLIKQICISPFIAPETGINRPQLVFGLSNIHAFVMVGRHIETETRSKLWNKLSDDIEKDEKDTIHSMEIEEYSTLSRI